MYKKWNEIGQYCKYISVASVAAAGWVWGQATNPEQNILQVIITEIPYKLSHCPPLMCIIVQVLECRCLVKLIIVTVIIFYCGLTGLTTGPWGSWWKTVFCWRSISSRGSAITQTNHWIGGGRLVLAWALLLLSSLRKPLCHRTNG